MIQSLVPAGDNIIHDEIYGYGGDDTIDNSVGGKSWIEAGDGDDVITGGASEDHIRGQDGDDTLSGNDGNDNWRFWLRYIPIPWRLRA